MSAFRVVCLCFLVTQVFGAGHESLITLHFVPHSHCEPGGNKTFEEYYQDDVRSILEGVIAELGKNGTVGGLPLERKFIWSEVAFFERWWRDRTTSQLRAAVHYFASKGQLEFVGGGWVQNDDAVTPYTSIINQVTLGHDFLARELGVKPVNVWQIDSYGVSSLAPMLWANFSWNMQGCNNPLRGMVINRIDHRDKVDLEDDQRMAFYWEPSRTLGDEGSMFTVVLPDGYKINIASASDIERVPFSDDQVQAVVTELLDYVEYNLLDYFTGHDILIPWGGDFAYKNAAIFFANTDKIIAAIMSPSYTRDNGISFNARYSTLNTYFRSMHSLLCPRSAWMDPPDGAEDTAVYARQSVSPDKTNLFEGEFLPYIDDDGNIYSGLFATRPDMKRLARQSEAVTRAAEQLHSLLLLSRYASDHVPANDAKDPMIENMVAARKANALFTHHLAITGMVTDRVMDDYEEKLDDAIEKCASVIEDASTMLMSKTGALSGDDKKNLQMCSMWRGNVRCPNMQNPEGMVFPLVLYNSLTWTRHDVVRIAVPSPFVIVKDSENFEVPAQISSVWNASGATRSLTFIAEVGPLSHTTYFLVFQRGMLPADSTTYESKAKVFYPATSEIKSEETMPDRSQQYRLGRKNTEPIVIENDELRLTFSKTTGLLDSVTTSNQLQKMSLGFLNYRLGGNGAFLLPNETTEAEWAWAICGLCYIVGMGIGRLLRWKPCGPLRKLKYEAQPTKISLGVALVTGLLLAAFFAVVSDLNLQDLGITVAVLAGVFLGLGIGLLHSFVVGGTLMIGFGFGISMALAFMPEGLYEVIDTDSLMLFVREGPIFSEVIQVFSEKLSVVNRLYNSEAFIGRGWEVMYRVSVAQNLNLVARLTTGLQNNGIFYTDNSLEMRKRKWDMNEPMAGNYYPAISAAYMREERSNLQYTVLTSTTIGVTSPWAGCMDMMLFNRADMDMDTKGDSREHEHDRKRLFIPTWNLFLTPDNADDRALRHKLSLQLNNPLFVMIGPRFGASSGAAEWLRSYRTDVQPLREDFPTNLHLVSLIARENASTNYAKKLAIRVGHMYEDQEDPLLSMPASVSIAEMFSHYTFSSVKEVDLALGPLDDINLNGTLYVMPLQIRAFEVEL